MMFTLMENLPSGFVGVVASGKVTADDRTQVLEPFIKGAVEASGRARLLYVAGFGLHRLRSWRAL